MRIIVPITLVVLVILAFSFILALMWSDFRLGEGNMARTVQQPFSQDREHEKPDTSLREDSAGLQNLV